MLLRAKLPLPRATRLPSPSNSSPSAVIRRPADLGLLMTLGSIHTGQKDGGNERLRWYQAAAAAAPGNAAALTNLGMSFQLFGPSQYANFSAAVGSASPSNSLVIVDTPSFSR